MRVAILGTRGIPARYGGFETFAENVALGLAGRGHEVVVYGRRALFKAPESTGAPLAERLSVRFAPTIFHKYLETPLAGLTSFIDSARRRYDCAIVCNAANAPFAWILRLARIPFALNVDGIERERGKWNTLGRCWYHLGERCAVWFSNQLVADADVIAAYYREHYKIAAVTIAYGASAVRRAGGATLAQFGLTAGKYILYVSRLEPENNALGVIQAYRAVRSELPLVIVGDAPYASEYKAQLRAAADARVVFTGYQFGSSYQELQSNCTLYIQATEVGGTHPALIESMAYGNAIIANGTPENIEVLGHAGATYPKNNFAALANEIQRLLDNPAERASLGSQAFERATQRYSWEAIIDQYETLLLSLVEKLNEKP